MKHKYQVVKWRYTPSGTLYDFFPLAPTPHDEQCTQAGYDHLKDGEFECAVLIDQLIRQHGAPPPGAEFFIIENDHEFGIYHEAAIMYSVPDEDKDHHEMTSLEQDVYDISVAAMEYAQNIEASIPDKWDDISLSELRKFKHHLYSPKAPGKLAKHQGKIVDIKSNAS